MSSLNRDHGHARGEFWQKKAVCQAHNCALHNIMEPPPA